ncbi:unnamed protein product [Choristocarpus tenellus]
MVSWYIEKLLPAVKEKMPWAETLDLIVQQDGAAPHTANDIPRKLNRVGKNDGWNIKLETQLAQSPDLNINDLGFFNSLKAVFGRKHLGTMENMAAGVRTLFDEYPAETLERVWQSLFSRYNQVLAALRGNNFELEHKGAGKSGSTCG